jgi:hypothetical protein
MTTGDFEEALLALLGKDAGGLSASTIARLKDAWSDEHLCWSKRDLSAKRYVYFWADGIDGGASSVARNVFNQSRSTMAEGIGSASRAAL